MLPAEQLRVAVFLAIVVLVFLRTAVVLRRWWTGRKRVAKPSGGPPARPEPAEGASTRRRSRAVAWLDRVVILAALGGVLCIAYGAFVEPYWPKVTRVRISTRKLARGASPIRIVQISDLHSDAAPRLETRLPGLVAAESPDLIVFTGDAINERAGLPVFRACLHALTAVAPVYAVQGNWDVWYWKDLRPLEGTGVRELDGDSARVTVRGSEIWLAGVAVGNEHAIPQLLQARPSDLFAIFLYHYPDEIREASRRGVDLYLAGHTHGGQVALPFYGALVTFSRFGKRYESGLYREGPTTLYVNRGIGMEGGVPRVRFCARPEVTVLEIAPAG